MTAVLVHHAIMECLCIGINMSDCIVSSINVCIIINISYMSYNRTNPTRRYDNIIVTYLNCAYDNNAMKYYLRIETFLKLNKTFYASIAR